MCVEGGTPQVREFWIISGIRWKYKSLLQRQQKKSQPIVHYVGWEVDHEGERSWKAKIGLKNLLDSKS